MAQKMPTLRVPSKNKTYTKMKKQTLKLIAAAFGMAGALSASAQPTPYPTPGTLNTSTYSFTATGSGNVNAYFAGQTAGFGSKIGMSVNGGAVGDYVLQNHSVPYGTSALLGSVNAGDVITFVMIASFDPSGPTDAASADLTWYSNPSLNSDGINHIYSSAYGGDLLIPAGTYVGFEDLPPQGAGGYGEDYDYDDHQFVFTGPFRATVPDGGSTALLLALGSLGLVAVRRRQK